MGLIPSMLSDAGTEILYIVTDGETQRSRAVTLTLGTMRGDVALYIGLYRR